MKNLFLFILFCVSISCKAQIYPLRTYTEVPANAYIQDINNELIPYEGTWKGTWNGKTVYIYLKRFKNYFTHLENNPYYNDILVGKFKIQDSSGTILFDSSNLTDENAKIKGSRFFSAPNTRYTLNYIDSDFCNTSGNVSISFTDTTKTKLSWNLNFRSNMITTDCQYYNTGIPEVLPKEILLTKQ
ncbi:DUF6705 family protein [Chryseobacterium sp.]|uniref:DUF6705 family protein n=1 Tax=Chryseobacterium sp. TaxID=1871047 RepID=UPI000EE7FEB3|nr:DUF6705 family protein [Chryseobacterium sp.]HCA09933.1 hypothetical protein [Chryseobacterium sp.]